MSLAPLGEQYAQNPVIAFFMRSEQVDVILWHTPYLSGYTKQFILSGHTKWLY